MVVAQKLYPRGTVKRIVKAHAGCNVSKNADVLVRFATPLCSQRSARRDSLTVSTCLADLSRLHALHARVSATRPDPLRRHSTI